MKAKIAKDEAFMAVDHEMTCLGIIAFSKTHIRITFFGVSHKANFNHAGKLLIDHALGQLDDKKKIIINVIKSNAHHIQSEKIENGVPIEKLIK